MSIPDLDGATHRGPEYAWPADPGEYAARWNQADQEQRAAHVANVTANGESAMHCWAGQHDIQIQALRGRVRQLLQEQDAGKAALAGARQSLAAVGGAADLARTQALADALEVMESTGNTSGYIALRGYISAEEGLPS